MPKILAHVHLYYPEMWEELKHCLQNITVNYDLFITMVEENADLQADILSLKPEAQIDLVPNKGFDIAPFLAVLNKVDLKDYDYIIKLHTKRDVSSGTRLKNFDVSGKKWREYLLAFLKTPKLFTKSLAAFAQDQKLGMIGDFRLIDEKDVFKKEAVAEALELLKTLGFAAKEYSYVMGTMFMARAKVFEPIKQMKLTAEDFAVSERYKEVLPYAFERLFGYIVGAQGYEIKDPLHSFSYKILFRIYTGIRNFIYRKKVKDDGTTIIKICKIPVHTVKRGSI